MAEAYIRGLERRLEEGKSVDINSVASFFVSRVDTEVDKRLEGTGHDDLLGQGRHRQRARRLPALRGDLPRRALRRPARRRRRRAAAAVGLDRREEPGLPRRRCTSRSSSGPNTVNTMPMATLLAAGDHAEIRGATAGEDPTAGPARRWPTPASTWTTSPTSCCARASTKFVEPMEKLLEGIDSKREAIVTQRPPSIDASLPDDVEPRVAARVKQAARGGRRAAHLAQGRHALGPGRPARGRQPPRLADRRPSRCARQLDDLRPSPRRSATRASRTSCCWAWAARRWRPRSSAARFGDQAGWPSLHVLDSTDAGADARRARAASTSTTRCSSSRRSRAGRSRRCRCSSTSGRCGPDGQRVRRHHRPGLRAWRSWRASTASGAPSSTTPTSAGATARCRSSASCPRRSWAPTWRAAATRAGVAEQNCQTLRLRRRRTAACGSGSRGASWRAAGRDKLTYVIDPPLQSFGLWVEQLIAESTGKQGKGILPVADEPLGDPGGLRRRPHLPVPAPRRRARRGDRRQGRGAARGRPPGDHARRSTARPTSGGSSSSPSSRSPSPAGCWGSTRSTSPTCRRPRTPPAACSAEGAEDQPDADRRRAARAARRPRRAELPRRSWATSSRPRTSTPR